MCGICGVIDLNRANGAEATVQRMMAVMQHRGPDDEGQIIDLPVALGMRRLSIIDLAGGQQPVYNENGSIVVVFNGEIYNFQELRHTLGAHGHPFHTHSDTEVIVHAYENWGLDCVNHMRGMFAFAVYDRRRATADRGDGGYRLPVTGRLFLARDRFGIKPLYYAFSDDRFLFASEVRALLASGLVPRRLSIPALHSYLLFGSIAQPMTLVEGVYSLPPGHCMSISVPGSTLKVECLPYNVQRYWDFASSGIRHQPSAISERRVAIGRLRSLLEESVRLHLIADVPLGVFLSSGIDSTALAALASRESSGIHTFTVVFPEEEFSEAELARRTAQRFGTTHQELVLSTDEMLAHLDEAVAALDQPSMDGINTYFVSWAARHAGLKVALSGLGGDEIFGGYSTFRSTPRLRRLALLACWTPAAVRAVVGSALEKVGERLGRPDAVRKLAALWHHPDALPHPYFFTRAVFTPAQVRVLLNGTDSHEAASPWWEWLAEETRQVTGFDDFNAVSRLESRSYLVSTLLRDTDAMSMAHSLEVRVPFLDHPLVEFVAQLPESMKQRRGIPKALLVDALGDLLPPDVVLQRKRTFTFPWEQWLRGALQEQVAAGLAEVTPALHQVLDRDAIQCIWQAFLAGQTSWSRPWSLYVLNAWVRRHLENGG